MGCSGVPREVSLMARQDSYKEEKKKDTSPKHRVLVAARDLFFSEGFAQVTTERLAQTACVSKTTIYKYFGNMTGVLRAVVIAESESFAAGVSFDPQTSEEFREGLVQFGVNFLKLIDDPQTTNFEMSILEQARAHPDVARTFYEAAHVKTQAALRDLIETGLERDLVKTDISAEDLADHLVNLWKGNRHSRAQLGFTDRRKRALHDWVRQCVKLVFG